MTSNTSLTAPSSFASDALADRTALVTGGTRGIGIAVARNLARHGAEVVITGRLEADAVRVAEALAEEGLAVRGRELEITDLSAAGDLVDRVFEELGTVDVLVNNAGTNIPQSAVDVTEEAWDTIHDANLKGLFFFTQAVARRWIEARGRGVVVNVASQAGLVAIDLRAAYCSSKAGVINLTRELALEWAQHNIRVNAVAPTFVLTPMTEPMLEAPGFRSKIIDMIPLGRVAEAHEVADAILFLASEASRFITGHTLVVDGGWTIQ